MLGASNSEAKTTTLKNIGAGAALSLQTKSTTSAPLVTNAKGMVKNFNANMVGGMTAGQLRGAALDALSFSFVRTNAVTAPVPYSGTQTTPSVVSGAGATATSYLVSGTVTFPCNNSTGPAASVAYGIAISLLDGNALSIVYQKVDYPLSACGKPMAIPPSPVTMSESAQLLVTGVGLASSVQNYYYPASMAINLTGKAVKAAL